MSSALERDGVLICERILSPGAIEQIRLYFDAINSGRAGSRPFDVPETIMDLICPDGPLGAPATQQAGQAATPVRVPSVRQDACLKLGGLLASGPNHRRQAASRCRWLWSLERKRRVWSTSSLLLLSCKTC
jgi:hypothetical protein